jgi:hypothetical protein
LRRLSSSGAMLVREPMHGALEPSVWAQRQHPKAVPARIEPMRRSKIFVIN